MRLKTGNKAGQGKTLTFFVHGIVWLFTLCVKPCSVIVENARSVILYEMINYTVCMKPVKARSVILYEMINYTVCMNPVKAEP